MPFLTLGGPSLFVNVALVTPWLMFCGPMALGREPMLYSLFHRCLRSQQRLADCSGFRFNSDFVQRSTS